MTDTPATEPAATPSGTPADTPAPGSVSDLESMRRSAYGTLVERMGIDLTEVSADRVVGTMPVEGNTQPYGLLHGGASVVLAETLGSIAAQLHAGEGRFAVGVDINATHHRAARDGVVTGVATPLHRGRTMASYEVVITDARGSRICTSRITCAVIEGRTPRPR